MKKTHKKKMFELKKRSTNDYKKSMKNINYLNGKYSYHLINGKKCI